MSGRRGSGVVTLYFIHSASSENHPLSLHDALPICAPPRSSAPSFDHFPFGPAILRRRVPSGTCAWGRQTCSNGASRQVRRVRKRRREGNEWAARVGRRYTIQRTIRWLSRTAVRWGPQFSSSAPAQIPRSFLRSFSLWARPKGPFIELEISVFLGIS